ncbi:MAG: hypothetical protein JWP75_1329 [Frondihabitans sp.]|nr:hypothetical protein [Frondihabitans sp.]
MEPVPVLGWVFTGLLFVLTVFSVAAGRGLVPKNHFAGIRFPALMRSDAAWRAGHAAAVFPAGIAFVVGLAFSVIGIIAPAAQWGSIVAFVGGLIWVVARATKAAKSS